MNREAKPHPAVLAREAFEERAHLLMPHEYGLLVHDAGEVPGSDGLLSASTSDAELAAMAERLTRLADERLQVCVMDALDWLALKRDRLRLRQSI